MVANARWEKCSLKLTLDSHACILLGIQALSPHVKGETPNLINVNMGYLKWHGGSKRKEKGCPDQRTILRRRTVASGSIHTLFIFLSY